MLQFVRFSVLQLKPVCIQVKSLQNRYTRFDIAMKRRTKGQSTFDSDAECFIIFDDSHQVKV